MSEWNKLYALTYFDIIATDETRRLCMFVICTSSMKQTHKGTDKSTRMLNRYE
jgi:hypothetical protein